MRSSSHTATVGLEAMIEAARRGDPGALEDLCTELYPKVRRMVHQSLSSDMRRKRPWLGALFSTGDVVQDVFISVTRDLGDIRGRGETALLQYITTLTRNRLVHAIRFYEAARRDRRRHDREWDAIDRVEEQRSGPGERVIHHEQIMRFHLALQTFSERHRILLRERIEHRRPFAELSQMLGFASADSARKTFHLAQSRLLHRLRSTE